MKESVFINEQQLVIQAVDILFDKLGPVEANRFLSLPRKKRIESVKRHQLWQSTLNKDEFFKEVLGSDQ